MPVNPHFSFPFVMTAGGASVTEQDTDAELLDCVEVILSVPLGFREDLPDFGLSDPVFGVGMDTQDIIDTVTRWEPRADVLVSARPDALDSLIQHVLVNVRSR
jgi:hypothetical protein